MHSIIHTRHIPQRVLIATLTVVLAFCMPVTAQTQKSDTWPNRPITLVVASGAGSGVDVAAREMAHKLGAALKQPVIVSNKPGASGMLAGATVAQAKADGYTLLYTNASYVTVAPAVLQNMSYDPGKDLTPIAQTAVGGIILLVNKDVPASNLQELMTLVKTQPENYNYGSWGAGSSAQLTMEWLKRKTGMQMTHVPYKTTPQIVNDLVSGVLQVGWSDPGTPVPMLENGRIKGIAISGTQRVPRTPDIATMREQGYPFDAVGWFGVFAPKNLPPSITDRLNTEINKIQASSEMRKRMEEMNFEPPPVKTAAAFKAIVAADMKTWRALAKDGNITFD